MFFNDLELPGVTKVSIEEGKDMLNVFLKSVFEDQTLHQCQQEV